MTREDKNGYIICDCGKKIPSGWLGIFKCMTCLKPHSASDSSNNSQ